MRKVSYNSNVESNDVSDTETITKGSQIKRA